MAAGNAGCPFRFLKFYWSFSSLYAIIFLYNASVVFGGMMGALVVRAEPAVYVPNGQGEEITEGVVPKKSMLIALRRGRDSLL